MMYCVVPCLTAFASSSSASLFRRAKDMRSHEMCALGTASNALRNSSSLEKPAKPEQTHRPGSSAPHRADSGRPGASTCEWLFGLGPFQSPDVLPPCSDLRGR